MLASGFEILKAANIGLRESMIYKNHKSHVFNLVLSLMKIISNENLRERASKKPVDLQIKAKISSSSLYKR